MFFAKRPSVIPEEISPPPAKPRLTERWLFAVGIGTLALAVLCGLY
jgi:hypothetical protein